MHARMLSILASVLTLAFPGYAAAQGAAAYPVKPIRMVVAVTPG